MQSIFSFLATEQVVKKKWSKTY